MLFFFLTVNNAGPEMGERLGKERGKMQEDRANQSVQKYMWKGRPAF